MDLRLDEEKNIAYIRLSGLLNERVILDAFDAAVADEHYRPGMFKVAAGEMGENITTRGVDLLGLPTSSLLHIGETAIVQVTGLRDPCSQLEAIQPGLMMATLDRDESGRFVGKAGAMGIVIAGGAVRAGDSVRVELPAQPHRPLEPV